MTMTKRVAGTVLQHLRGALLGHEGAGLTDGDLLQRFISERDEAAFAVLLRRHGPMVLGVCRRILRNEHDAEDAFQATFLVLVRRAASIQPRGLVGNWLYGTARNTALKARAMNRRRGVKEREAATRPQAAAPAEDWEQLHLVLEQALQALPAKYRAPIVLCDLEGKSIKEAARHLDCPPGTVGTRLARGRSLLGRRLARRGLTVAGGLLTAVLAQKTATGGVPLPLFVSTVKAASLFAAGCAATGVSSARVAALTEGVLKAMSLTPLKTAAALVLVLAVLATGAGLFLQQAPAARQGDPGNQGANAGPGKEAKDDKDKLQGTWKVVSAEVGGQVVEEAWLKRGLQKLIFTGDKVVLQSRDKIQEGTFKVYPSRQPKAIDMTVGEFISSTREAIYTLEGDNLTVCQGFGMAPRPASFMDEKVITFLLKREAAQPAKEDEKAAEKKEQVRLRSAENLSQLAMAMHRYHDEHGCFPPAAITNKDEVPLLSWRVRLLPYLGLGELYQQFHLDEPWDSKHNKALLAKMPKVYFPEGAATDDPHTTYYQVLVGKSTIFEPKEKVAVIDIPDGTVSTILIVEAKAAVPWTRPSDLPYAPDKQVPEMGGISKKGFNVATADGSVRFLKQDIDQNLLHALITRDGGELIDESLLDP
jgi:RNA polymerase sigma factor (sigma-70 family)